MRPACITPRCPNQAPKGYSRCDLHRRPYERQRDAAVKNPAHKKIYNSARWQKLRSIVLQRNPICRICGEKPSTDADHIIPLAEGGPAFKLSNLQGACHECHSGKTLQELKAR